MRTGGLTPVTGGTSYAPVPPLAPHSVLVYLAAIAVLLAVARLLGRLVARIGMPAIVEVVIALAGLRLGVLNTTTYTIVVLVALVTSVIAPPVLRHAMSRITQTDEELVRKIDHDTWDGDQRVQHAA
jgi:hypothetical protein